MADTVHNLQVRTTVKDLASKELRGLGQTGAGAGKSIAAGFIKAQLALGALKIAIRGVVNVVKSLTTDTARQGDAFAKMSDRLGIAVETLSAYSHVANLAGVNAKAFTIGLQRQTRRIATAATGMGEAVLALKELGLNAQELAKMTPDKQFLTLADALNKVESSGRKVALAFKLWDAEGVANLQIVNQGTAAIREQIREAERYGIVWTTSQAKVASAFIDAKTRLDAAIDGIKKALSIELLPALTGFLEKVSVFIAENRTKIVDGLKDVFTTVGAMVLTAFKELSTQFARLIDMIESLQKLTAQDIAKKFAANTVRSALTLFGTPKGGADAAVLGIFGSTSGPREKAMLEFWARVDVAISKVKDNLASMASDKGAPGTGISGASIWSGISDAVNDEASTGNGAKVVASDIWHAITEAMGEVPPEPVKPGFLDGIRKAVAGIREQLTPEALGMTTVSMLTNAWTNFFDAIVFGSEKAEDAFRNMAISMLRQVSQMANQAFMSEIFGALSGAGGGGGAGAGEPQNIGQASGQLRNSSGMRLQIRQAAGSGL